MLSFMIKTDLPRYVISISWILINLISFLIVFFQYENSLKYFYLRKIIKHGLSFSRASAFCINMNCALLMLPVCRNFISYTRYFLCCSTNVVRVLDKHISFHRQIGYTIMFFSIIHTLGHVFNFESFVVGYDMKLPSNSSSDKQKYAESGLISTLSHLQSDKLNPVRGSIPVFEAFKLLPGVTGILLCLILSIVASSSSAFIRRSFFNLFWYMHQILAFLFFIFFIVHGLQGIVRAQVNIEKNDPQKCYQLYFDWSRSPEKVCDIPKFKGSAAQSWAWVILSLFIYFLERLVRFIRSLKKHTIIEYKNHPSKVLEIVIDNSGKNKIKYRAGQYLYLNVTDISFFEWHPFTITSSPDDSNLTVHIRCEGDWTTNLQEKILSSEPSQPGISKISIDGPYGTCAEDIFKYESVVLIGAGIGVTPYSSILKHIWYMACRDTEIKLKKIYFFWICPNIDTFEWFGQLLYDLEKKMKRKTDNSEQLLEYKIYLTKGWSMKEAKQITLNNEDDRDLFTGLEQKTHYGRPNFDLFFQELAIQKATDSGLHDIGVFFCGPPILSKDLHKFCNKHSNENVRFYYNKESF